MPVTVAFQPARVRTESTAAIFTRFLLPTAMLRNALMEDDDSGAALRWPLSRECRG
jgi:hypothetical protein